MFEETRGIAQEEGVYFENAWTGFAPTHRWIAECGAQTEAESAFPIAEPKVTPFRSEEPAVSGLGAVERESEGLAMRRDITGSSGASGSKDVAFWDTRAGDALGLFFRDNKRCAEQGRGLSSGGETLDPDDEPEHVTCLRDFEKHCCRGNVSRSVPRF